MNDRRSCFVIMPFSNTRSCRQDEWTTIFQELIRPAVEESGLGFTCRRSDTVTGNVIRDILMDLHAANVVIADLTDQRANVMYELGVRHALATRTIMIAQRSKDIPSDLKSYKYYIYDWKTNQDKQNFRARIAGLLAELVNAPRVSDNPIADFLDVRVNPGVTLHPDEHGRFGELLASATTELLAVAPSLLYVAHYMKPLVFQQAKKGVSIKLLIMANAPSGVRFIAEYAGTPHYEQQLALCHSEFRSWLEEAAAEGLDIRVRLAPIVPLSITIVDGGQDDGRLLIVPLPYGTGAPDRPCILMEKRGCERPFALYYERYTDWWAQCPPLQ